MSPRMLFTETSKFWLKLSLVFFAVLLVTVWEHVQALSLERQVVVMRKEADRLTFENGRLQNQIHQKTSPSYLDAVARKDLHMLPVDENHTIGIHK